MVRWLCSIAAAFFLISAQSAQAQSLVGQWDWGAGGGIVDIYEGGTGRDSRGNTMQWTADDSGLHLYSLIWSHGFTDKATLSEDGNTVDIINNVGTRFAATRRGLSRSVAADDISGSWTWGVGAGTVEIYPDGKGKDGRGNVMTWQQKNAPARTYELKWSNGYTDTATLQPDGRILDIINSGGTRFTATRIGGSKDIGAIPVIDLNGSWNNALLHIWQDGPEVLVTASWKRVDGKWVIWRGEGTISGNVVDLKIRYSPMPHGPVGLWLGRLTVSADGNMIDAIYTYSTPGAEPDHRVYHRDP